jgi:hypothetical protein
VRSQVLAVASFLDPQTQVNKHRNTQKLNYLDIMNISIISTNKNPLRQTYIKHITNMLVPASILAMESRFSPSGSPPGKMYLLTNALVKHVKQLMTHHDVHMTYLLFTSVHHSCHRKL